MQDEDVEEIVEDKLYRIEKNIVQLCTNVHARLDASTKQLQVDVILKRTEYQNALHSTHCNIYIIG